MSFGGQHPLPPNAVFLVWYQKISFSKATDTKTVKKETPKPETETYRP